MLRAETAEEALQLLTHPKVKDWHEYIVKKAVNSSNHFLLFVPCAKSKPYTRDTDSLFYQWLWNFLSEPKLRKKVFISTISEPFGVIPETDYERMPNYDLPPRLLKENPSVLQKYVEKLGTIIAEFLRRNKGKYQEVLAYVRPDNTHKRFLDRADNLSEENIEFVVEMDTLEDLKKDHRRTWQLNWMIFLEDQLKRRLLNK